ncbi:MAG: hypothetical protein H7175_27690 [Burkholderiales bacterium]|nr:hypothetical protein [Anaerolineae bacterium]
MLASFIAVIFACYVINLLVAWSSYTPNKSKWDTAGISNYTLSVAYQIAFLEAQTTAVRDGETTQVSGEAPYNYAISSVDELFEEASQCRLPLLSLCSIEYDEQFGYPTKLVSRCPMIDCYTEIRVTAFEPQNDSIAIP